MSGGVTVSEDGIVTGNTYDKYGSTNPLVRRMMAGFERTLDELFTAADPESLLDVGCGEGVLVHSWAHASARARVVGIDLEEPSIQAGWEQRKAPNLEYRVMRAENLPFADGEFDVVSGDRGARARPRPRAHARRDGALRAAPPARVGAARAAVADAQHGARGLLASAGQHSRAISTTGPSARSCGCSRATARWSRRARRSPGRCCLSASSQAPGQPPDMSDRPSARAREASQMRQGRVALTAAARACSRSGSPARGC